jgi:hypothetical protein
LPSIIDALKPQAFSAQANTAMTNQLRKIGAIAQLF